MRSGYRWGPVPARASWAFAWLLVFVALVYTNPSNLFPALGDYGYAKMAAGVAIAVLAGSWLLMDRRVVLGGGIGVCLTLFFAGVALSAIWSPAPSLTLRSFVEWVKYLAIFYLVANVVDERRRVDILSVALAWATLAPALGTINSWSHGEHLVEGDRAAWIGVFNNPNELAYYLAIGGAFALGALSLTRRRWLRLGYVGALLVMATALLLTQSRGGLMAAITVLGLTLLRATDQKNRGAIVAVGVVLLLAIQFTPQKVWQRASTTFAYQQDASAQGRIDAWRTGLNMVAARPLTGVGAGAFVLAWPEYAPGRRGRGAHGSQHLRAGGERDRTAGARSVPRCGGRGVCRAPAGGPSAAGSCTGGAYHPDRPGELPRIERHRRSGVLVAALSPARSGGRHDADGARGTRCAGGARRGFGRTPCTRARRRRPARGRLTAENRPAGATRMGQEQSSPMKR